MNSKVLASDQNSLPTSLSNGSVPLSWFNILIHVLSPNALVGPNKILIHRSLSWCYIVSWVDEYSHFLHVCPLLFLLTKGWTFLVALEWWWRIRGMMSALSKKTTSNAISLISLSVPRYCLKVSLLIFRLIRQKECSVSEPLFFFYGLNRRGKTKLEVCQLFNR